MTWTEGTDSPGRGGTATLRVREGELSPPPGAGVLAPFSWNQVHLEPAGSRGVKLAGVLGLGDGSPRVPKRNVDTRCEGSTGSWRAAKRGGSFLFSKRHLVYLGALAPTLALWSGGADSAPSPR